MDQKSVPSREHYDAHYQDVRDRAGLTAAHELEPAFENRVREIFNGYWAERERPETLAIKKALNRYMSGQATLRSAIPALDQVVCEIAVAARLVDSSTQDRKERIQEGIREVLDSWAEPRALARYFEGKAVVQAALETLGRISSEILLAAELVDLSTEDREQKIDGYLGFRAETDHLTRAEIERYGELVSSPPFHELTQAQNRGIEFLKDNPEVLARLLKRRKGDYRKDAETALVVEPALDLLDAISFAPSKKLTRKAFFEALFNLLGIEQRKQPNAASINVIVDRRKKARVDAT
jgi:hypothetical protein